MKARALVLLVCAAAAASPGIRILEPPDGAVLNRHDGERTVEGLRIAVKGTASGASVLVNGKRVKVSGGRFESAVVLKERENRIAAADGPQTHSITVLWDRDSVRRYRFSVDDNIRWLQDIARNRYASLFDNAYLAFWREMHRKYRTKVHFNIYYETRRFRLFSGFWGEVQATTLEVDGMHEVLPAPEAASRVLHPLDLGVNGFAARIRDAVPEIRVLGPIFGRHPRSFTCPSPPVWWS